MSRGPIAYLRGKYDKFFIGLGRTEDYESKRFRLFDASPAGFAMRVINTILVALFFLLMIYGYLTANPEVGLFIPWIYVLPVCVVVKIIRETLDYWWWRADFIPEVREVNYDENADMVINGISSSYSEMHEHIVDSKAGEDELNNEIHVEEDESDSESGKSLSEDPSENHDMHPTEKFEDSMMDVKPLPASDFLNSPK